MSGRFRISWPLLLPLGLISACSYGQWVGVAGQSVPSAPPALAGPTGVRTVLPVPPTPKPPSPTPTPVYSPPIVWDPFLDVFGDHLPVGQDFSLLSMPPNNPIQLTWQLAPGQDGRATLSGNILRPLKPGGILLVAHAADHVAYAFFAAQTPGIATEESGWFPDLDGYRIFNSNDAWQAYRTSRLTSPSFAQLVPPLDFTNRSLLLYRTTAAPNEQRVYVTDVSSDTVDLTIAGSVAQGESRYPMPSVQIAAMIPRVPASATVRVERMPSLTVPSATPFPQPSRPSTPQPVEGTP